MYEFRNIFVCHH